MGLPFPKSEMGDKVLDVFVLRHPHTAITDGDKQKASGAYFRRQA